MTKATFSILSCSILAILSAFCKLFNELVIMISLYLSLPKNAKVRSLSIFALSDHSL